MKATLRDLVLSAFWFAGPLAARAQEPAAAAAPAAESLPGNGGGLSLWEIIQSGGAIMIVLGALSVVGLALVFYLFFTLRRERVVPSALVEEAEAAADRGDIGALAAACEEYPSPTAQILYTGLERGRSGGALVASLFHEASEAEGARQVAALRQQIRYLYDLSVVSPIIGLLGTVLGMMRSFNAVVYEFSRVKPLALAGGVAQALVTTAFGLLVAIPAMILYSYFRGRVSRLTAEMESVCGEIAARLGGKTR